jgi:hypothetical protein
MRLGYHGLAFVVVSEIGLGFSPDLENGHRLGFSPWDMSSSGQTTTPQDKKHVPGAKAQFV